MESLYFLVPCALIFIGLAIKVLFWALNNGQYDNLDTEAHRILFDTEQSKQDKSSQDKPSQEKSSQDKPSQEKSTPAPEAPDDKTPSV